MNMLPENDLNNQVVKPVDKSLCIPFNVPFNNQAAFGETISSSIDCSSLFKGRFASGVYHYFKENYVPEEVVLTASCTNALELAALLLDLKKGDEVIIPAYTYVSTANAFELRGARLRLCDSSSHSPNMDLNQLESLITPKTKAIVVIHYGGISPNMYRLKEIAERHQVWLIEDAAHAIDAWYDGKRLGTFGDLATFSFHETKNVTSGQGGVLLINHANLKARAHILRDCGTNRHNFHLGLVDKYTWVDVGSVYNLSELCCAYLYPQLIHLKSITRKRKQLWENYYNHLLPLQERGLLRLPFVSDLSDHNAHIFYIILQSQPERDRLLHYLKSRGITATFHYSGLHQCPYYQKKYPKTQLVNAEKYAGRLLRLPLYYDLSLEQQAYIVESIALFFQKGKRNNPAKSIMALPIYLNFILEDSAYIVDTFREIFVAIG